MLCDIAQHFREALRVAYLVLHVVTLLKHGEVTVRVCLHHSVTVLEMILDAAELKVGVPLQLLRKLREELILKAVLHLAAHIAVSKRLARRDEVGADRIIVASEYLFERRAL